MPTARERILKDLKKNPHMHKHNFAAEQVCCTLTRNGRPDPLLLEAHAKQGVNTSPTSEEPLPAQH